MPKKKEKIVTLRMNQESYQTIEDYAKVKGLSSPAVLFNLYTTLF